MAVTSLAKKKVEPAPANKIDLEEASWNVRVALGIATALCLMEDAGEHEKCAACAVADYLVKARDILDGKEVDHA